MEEQEQEEKKNIIDSVFAFSRKTDVWWRKFTVLVWALVLLFLLYVGIMWILDKIGL